MCTDRYTCVQIGAHRYRCVQIGAHPMYRCVQTGTVHTYRCEGVFRYIHIYRFVVGTYVQLDVEGVSNVWALPSTQVSDTKGQIDEISADRHIYPEVSMLRTILACLLHVMC